MMAWAMLWVEVSKVAGQKELKLIGESSGANAVRGGHDFCRPAARGTRSEAIIHTTGANGKSRFIKTDEDNMGKTQNEQQNEQNKTKNIIGFRVTGWSHTGSVLRTR
jgi:hypothetical protein